MKRRRQDGMDADVAVFDPETIRDVGTYEDPSHPAGGRADGSRGA
jgi:N-acyl-D-glutamate deacylase